MSILHNPNRHGKPQHTTGDLIWWDIWIVIIKIGITVAWIALLIWMAKRLG